MKLSFSTLLSLSGVVFATSLTGCSGVSAIPDTVAATSPGEIHGSVFGGHAPVVGAHVYVLEAGQTGYGSKSVSKLTTGVATDTIGTFVVTDQNGGFTITGDYSCDVGHPVYLAAAGATR